jgi:hypothetical protein
MSVSEDQDFAIDDGDLLPAAGQPVESPPAAPESPAPAAAAPAASPRVVIEYRNRRFLSPLLPPLLILLAAVGIMMYQRQAKLRPAPPPAVATKPSVSAPEGAAPKGRIIMVEAAGTGAAIEPIAVRTAPPPPAPPPPILPPASLPDPDAVPAPAPAGPPPERVADAGGPAEPGPFAPMNRDVGAAVGPIATGPPLEPPEPLTSSTNEPLSADSPELAFDTGVRRPPVQKPEPKVTREAILMEIEAESQQKKAQEEQLKREVAESKYQEFVAGIQRIQNDRQPFHDELRRAIRELGEEAGPEIKAICDRYGRDTHPVIETKVRLDMRRWSARVSRGAKIEKLRINGLPEVRIFDYLAGELDSTIGTRGGPLNQNGVRVRAAKLLLMYPPAAPSEPRSTAAPRATATARAPGAP